MINYTGYTLKQSNVLQLTTHEWTLSNIMRTAALSHSQKKNIEGSLQCCWLACQIHPVLGFDFSLIYYGVIPFCSARAYVSVNWIYLASFQHKKRHKYDDRSSCHITLFLQAWKIPAAQHKQWILYLCEFIFKIVIIIIIIILIIIIIILVIIIVLLLFRPTEKLQTTAVRLIFQNSW